MKKTMVAISAAIIGISCSSSETVVMAGQIGEENRGKAHRLEDYLPEDFPKETVSLFESEGIRFEKQIPDLFNAGDVKEESTKAGMGETETDTQAGKTDKEHPSSEIKDLQVPQKLNVVIDPWEQDGKEQVYSQQYTIKNTGEYAGMLTLSRLTCRPQEMSGVEVKTDRSGLHEGGRKSVYMELLFGNGEKIILSETSAEYKTELQPGEELLFCFTGAVNEYADKEWENEDISIEVMYSWTADAGDENVDLGDQTENVSEVSGREEAEKTAEEVSESSGSGNDGSLDTGQDHEEETYLQEEENVEENGEENLPGDGKTNEEVLEPGESSLAADTWEADEDGRIVSAEYVLRNTGETAGTLTISDLVCEIQEQRGIVWKTKREELQDTEIRAIYIEMELKNGEKVTFSQKEQEENENWEGKDSLEYTGYKVELKPGEELVFWFTGEMKGIQPEDLEEHEILVKAFWSWVLDGAVQE